MLLESRDMDMKRTVCPNGLMVCNMAAERQPEKKINYITRAASVCQRPLAHPGYSLPNSVLIYQSNQRNLEAAVVFSAAESRSIRRFCTSLCHIQARTRYGWQRNPVSLRAGRRKTYSGPNPRKECEVIGSMTIDTFLLLRQYSTVINTA